MKVSLLIVTALGALVEAVAWKEPRATKAAQEIARAMQGRSPAPTDGPKLKPAAARQLIKRDFETNVCGYESGLSAEAVSCLPGDTCYFFTQPSAWGMAGCCPGSDRINCGWAIDCVDRLHYSEDCGSNCQVDPFTLKCTNIFSPYCQYFRYTSPSVLAFGCGTSSESTWRSVEVTYAGEQAPSLNFAELSLTKPISTPIGSFGPSHTQASITQTGGEDNNNNSTDNNDNSGDHGDSENENSHNTHNDHGTTIHKKKKNIGAIAGGAAGGAIVVIGLIVLAIILCIRSSKKKKQRQAQLQQPQQQPLMGAGGPTSPPPMSGTNTAYAGPGGQPPYQPTDQLAPPQPYGANTTYYAPPIEEKGPVAYVSSASPSPYITETSSATSPPPPSQGQQNSAVVSPVFSHRPLASDAGTGTVLSTADSNISQPHSPSPAQNRESYLSTGTPAPPPFSSAAPPHPDAIQLHGESAPGFTPVIGPDGMIIHEVPANPAPPRP